MGVKIEKYHASEIAILHSLQFYIYWRFFFLALHFMPVHSKSIQTFTILLKIAKQDVTKMPFSQKNIDEFFRTFGGKRQIDARCGA